MAKYKNNNIYEYILSQTTDFPVMKFEREKQNVETIKYHHTYKNLTEYIDTDGNKYILDTVSSITPSEFCEGGEIHINDVGFSSIITYSSESYNYRYDKSQYLLKVIYPTSLNFQYDDYVNANPRIANRISQEGDITKLIVDATEEFDGNNVNMHKNVFARFPDTDFIDYKDHSIENNGFEYNDNFKPKYNYDYEYQFPDTTLETGEERFNKAFNIFNSATGSLSLNSAYINNGDRCTISANVYYNKAEEVFFQRDDRYPVNFLVEFEKHLPMKFDVVNNTQTIYLNEIIEQQLEKQEEEEQQNNFIKSNKLTPLVINVREINGERIPRSGIVVKVGTKYLTTPTLNSNNQHIYGIEQNITDYFGIAFPDPGYEVYSISDAHERSISNLNFNQLEKRVNILSPDSRTYGKYFEINGQPIGSPTIYDSESNTYDGRDHIDSMDEIINNDNKYLGIEFTVNFKKKEPKYMYIAFFFVDDNNVSIYNSEYISNGSLKLTDNYGNDPYTDYVPYNDETTNTLGYAFKIPYEFGYKFTLNLKNTNRYSSFTCSFTPSVNNNIVKITKQSNNFPGFTALDPINDCPSIKVNTVKLHEPNGKIKIRFYAKNGNNEEVDLNGVNFSIGFAENKGDKYQDSITGLQTSDNYLYGPDKVGGMCIVSGIDTKYKNIGIILPENSIYTFVSNGYYSSVINENISYVSNIAYIQIRLFIDVRKLGITVIKTEEYSDSTGSEERNKIVKLNNLYNPASSIVLDWERNGIGVKNYSYVDIRDIIGPNYNGSNYLQHQFGIYRLARTTDFTSNNQGWRIVYNGLSSQYQGATYSNQGINFDETKYYLNNDLKDSIEGKIKRYNVCCYWISRTKILVIGTSSPKSTDSADIGIMGIDKSTIFGGNDVYCQVLLMYESSSQLYSKFEKLEISKYKNCTPSISSSNALSYNNIFGKNVTIYSQSHSRNSIVNEIEEEIENKTTYRSFGENINTDEYNAFFENNERKQDIRHGEFGSPQIEDLATLFLPQDITNEAQNRIKYEVLKIESDTEDTEAVADIVLYAKNTRTGVEYALSGDTVENEETDIIVPKLNIYRTGECIVKASYAADEYYADTELTYRLIVETKKECAISLDENEYEIERQIAQMVDEDIINDDPLVANQFFQSPLPTITSDEEVPVSFEYVSSNDDIGEHYQNGVILVYDTGIIKITIYLKESKKYKSAETSYILRIIPKAPKTPTILTIEKAQYQVRFLQYTSIFTYRYYDYYEGNKTHLMYETKDIEMVKIIDGLFPKKIQELEPIASYIKEYLLNQDENDTIIYDFYTNDGITRCPFVYKYSNEDTESESLFDSVTKYKDLLEYNDPYNGGVNIFDLENIVYDEDFKHAKVRLNCCPVWNKNGNFAYYIFPKALSNRLKNDVNGFVKSNVSGIYIDKHIKETEKKIFGNSYQHAPGYPIYSSNFETFGIQYHLTDNSIIQSSGNTKIISLKYVTEAEYEEIKNEISLEKIPVGSDYIYVITDPKLMIGDLDTLMVNNNFVDEDLKWQIFKCPYTTNNTDDDIKYTFTSSRPEIARTNAQGDVMLYQPGKVKIMINSSETENFTSGEIGYTLEILEKEKPILKSKYDKYIYYMDMYLDENGHPYHTNPELDLTDTDYSNEETFLIYSGDIQAIDNTFKRPELEWNNTDPDAKLEYSIRDGGNYPQKQNFIRVEDIEEKNNELPEYERPDDTSGQYTLYITHEDSFDSTFMYSLGKLSTEFKDVLVAAAENDDNIKVDHGTPTTPIEADSGNTEGEEGGEGGNNGGDSSSSGSSSSSTTEKSITIKAVGLKMFAYNNKSYPFLTKETGTVQASIPETLAPYIKEVLCYIYYDHNNNSENVTKINFDNINYANLEQISKSSFSPSENSDTIDLFKNFFDTKGLIKENNDTIKYDTSTHTCFLHVQMNCKVIFAYPGAYDNVYEYHVEKKDWNKSDWTDLNTSPTDLMLYSNIVGNNIPAATDTNVKIAYFAKNNYSTNKYQKLIEGRSATYLNVWYHDDRFTLVRYYTGLQGYDTYYVYSIFSNNYNNNTFTNEGINNTLYKCTAVTAASYSSTLLRLGINFYAEDKVEENPTSVKDSYPWLFPHVFPKNDIVENEEEEIDISLLEEDNNIIYGEGEECGGSEPCGNINEQSEGDEESSGGGSEPCGENCGSSEPCGETCGSSEPCGETCGGSEPCGETLPDEVTNDLGSSTINKLSIHVNSGTSVEYNGHFKIDLVDNTSIHTYRGDSSETGGNFSKTNNKYSGTSYTFDSLIFFDNRGIPEELRYLWWESVALATETDNGKVQILSERTIYVVKGEDKSYLSEAEKQILKDGAQNLINKRGKKITGITVYYYDSNGTEKSYSGTLEGVYKANENDAMAGSSLGPYLRNGNNNGGNDNMIILNVNINGSTSTGGGTTTGGSSTGGSSSGGSSTGGSSTGGSSSGGSSSNSSSTKTSGTGAGSVSGSGSDIKGSSGNGSSSFSSWSESSSNDDEIPNYAPFDPKDFSNSLKIKKKYYEGTSKTTEYEVSIDEDGNLSIGTGLSNRVINVLVTSLETDNFKKRYYVYNVIILNKEKPTFGINPENVIVRVDGDGVVKEYPKCIDGPEITCDNDDPDASLEIGFFNPEKYKYVKENGIFKLDGAGNITVSQNPSFEPGGKNEMNIWIVSKGTENYAYARTNVQLCVRKKKDPELMILYPSQTLQDSKNSISISLVKTIQGTQIFAGPAITHKNTDPGVNITYLSEDPSVCGVNNNGELLVYGPTKPKQSIRITVFINETENFAPTDGFYLVPDDPSKPYGSYHKLNAVYYSINNIQQIFTDWVDSGNGTNNNGGNGNNNNGEPYEEEIPVNYGWYKYNYKVDAAIDDYLINEYNFGAQTISSDAKVFDPTFNPYT